MPQVIQAQEFLQLSAKYPVIDVRSPGEYENAHIPGALALPLFSNEERAIIGTIYKKSGKVKAVTKGLEIAGPKLSSFAKFALSLKSDYLLLYCWRGGMRSSSMAWLLETLGINCLLLEGGYKSYRSYIRAELAKPYKLIVMGGYTGSGKTELLLHLKNNNSQVVDLEAIANHKGSAFGAIGQPDQPSNEMFENNLYYQLSRLNRSQTIWVEDESHNVGRVFIPEEFFGQMRLSPIIVIEAPFNQRLQRLLNDYGNSPVDHLKHSIKKIEKRLGYDNCKMAIEACDKGNLKLAAEICLTYYDKAYSNQLETRYSDKLNSLPKITFSNTEISQTIKSLIQLADTI